MRGYRRHRGFDFGDFEITKREILASISIIAVMLLIGVLIAGRISDWELDRNEKYNKAIKIKTQDLFEYGMRTNVGNAFVYGELEAVDTVTYPELDSVYMYVEKVKERYTKHTRQVAHTNLFTDLLLQLGELLHSDSAFQFPWILFILFRIIRRRSFSES